MNINDNKIDDIKLIKKPHIIYREGKRRYIKIAGKKIFIGNLTKIQLATLLYKISLKRKFTKVKDKVRPIREAIRDQQFQSLEINRLINLRDEEEKRNKILREELNTTRIVSAVQPPNVTSQPIINISQPPVTTSQPIINISQPPVTSTPNKVSFPKQIRPPVKFIKTINPSKSINKTLLEKDLKDLKQKLFDSETNFIKKEKEAMQVFNNLQKQLHDKEELSIKKFEEYANNLKLSDLDKENKITEFREDLHNKTQQILQQKSQEFSKIIEFEKDLHNKTQKLLQQKIQEFNEQTELHNDTVNILKEEKISILNDINKLEGESKKELDRLNKLLKEKEDDNIKKFEEYTNKLTLSEHDKEKQISEFKLLQQKTQDYDKQINENNETIKILKEEKISLSKDVDKLKDESKKELDRLNKLLKEKDNDNKNFFEEYTNKLELSKSDKEKQISEFQIAQYDKTKKLLNEKELEFKNEIKVKEDIINNLNAQINNATIELNKKNISNAGSIKELEEKLKKSQEEGGLTHKKNEERIKKTIEDETNKLKFEHGKEIRKINSEIDTLNSNLKDKLKEIKNLDIEYKKKIVVAESTFKKDNDNLVKTLEEKDKLFKNEIKKLEEKNELTKTEAQEEIKKNSEKLEKHYNYEINRKLEEEKINIDILKQNFNKEKDDLKISKENIESELKSSKKELDKTTEQLDKNKQYINTRVKTLKEQNENSKKEYEKILEDAENKHKLQLIENEKKIRDTELNNEKILQTAGLKLLPNILDKKLSDTIRNSLITDVPLGKSHNELINFLVNSPDYSNALKPYLIYIANGKITNSEQLAKLAIDIGRIKLNKEKNVDFSVLDKNTKMLGASSKDANRLKSQQEKFSSLEKKVDEDELRKKELEQINALNINELNRAYFKDVPAEINYIKNIEDDMKNNIEKLISTGKSREEATQIVQELLKIKVELIKDNPEILETTSTEKLPQKGEGIELTGEKNMLYGDEIEKIMKPLHNKGFKGVYSIDEIKDIPVSKKMSAIINLDPSYKKGSHWVSLNIDTVNDKSIEWYDSLAGDIPNYAMKQIKVLIDKLDPPTYLKLKVNKIKNQRSDSSTCGYFAMGFIIDRLKGKKFKDVSGYSDANQGEKNIKKEFGLI